MASNESAKPLLLDYAPAPGVARRILRSAIRYLLLGGVMVAVWIWGPPVWHQARMLYWQRQCMNFTAGPDELVYDGEIVSGRTPAPPPCWAEFVDATAKVGPALSGLPLHGTLVFLGELKTPSGEPHLVAVALTSQRNWWLRGYLEPGISYQMWVVAPGTSLNPPKSISQNIRPNELIETNTIPSSLQLHFGQRDAADPSHFTIRYRVWGQVDVVEGRIDNAGQVTLTQRNPPSTRPRG